MEKILAAMLELLLPLRYLDRPERIKGLLQELGYEPVQIETLRAQAAVA